MRRNKDMEEYKDISRGLKMLLDKAEEMGWNWEAYIEPDNRRTYVEIGQSSPAGEDFSMTIDFDEENQADSFKDSLESYYEDFDIDEHIEMWIEAKRSGTSGVPSARELVKDAEAIDDIMCGALEGGITYWCDEAKVVGDYLGEYGSEQIARGGKLRLHLPEPFDKDETEYYELDLEKFKKGVELWAITPVGCNCLEQMDGKIRFDTCNADAIVCDAIIQYALFGTVVFG